MRFVAISLLVLATFGSTAAKPKQAAHPVPDSSPPHAWLFGAWTGGLFPVLDGMAAQDCRTQPTVRFARDLVSFASLLSTTMATRTIQSVRATANGAEFRFVPATDPAPGFGCENADELHVVRSNANDISFPNCSAFPYPLERCPTG